MFFRRKWKPNRAQKEAYKEKINTQADWLKHYLDLNKHMTGKWNDNYSSLYLTNTSTNTGYRISTHHLPDYQGGYRDYQGAFNGTQLNPDNKFIEKVTRSRDNIMKYAEDVAKEKEKK